MTGCQRVDHLWWIVTNPQQRLRRLRKTSFLSYEVSPDQHNLWWIMMTLNWKSVHKSLNFTNALWRVRNVGGSTWLWWIVTGHHLTREQVINIAVQLFFLCFLLSFMQVVECIAESLSILETPLQVKVRRHITLSFQKSYFLFVPLSVDWPMFNAGPR